MNIAIGVVVYVGMVLIATKMVNRSVTYRGGRGQW